MDLSFHQPPGAVFLSIPPAPLNFKMLLLHVSMSVFMALMYFVRGHAFFLGTKETPNHIEIGRGGSESPPRNKFVHAEKKKLFLDRRTGRVELVWLVVQPPL